MPRTTTNQTPQSFDRIAATVAALVIVGLAVFLLIRNQPIADLKLFFVLRVVLSLSAATLGASIPGFLNLRWSGAGLVIRAGGALALFVLTFVYTPDLVKEENGGVHVHIKQTSTGSFSPPIIGNKGPIYIGPRGSNAPTCTPAVLKTINLPDVPTLDGNGSHVGGLSGISVSVVRECPTPTEAKYRFHLDYAYYNGSGTWRGEQHLILVLKSREGDSLKAAVFPLDRSRCVYGGAERRSANGMLDGGTGTLVSTAELTVSRVSGTQTGC